MKKHSSLNDQLNDQSALWSPGASDWAIQEATFMPLYNEILQHLALNNDHSLLDIGCGTGLFLSLLSKNPCKSTGMDISPSALEIAKRRMPGGVFIESKMEHLPFADHVFDTVVCNNALQYSTDINASLKEIYRVLKVAGKFLISLWGEPVQCDSYAYFQVFYSLTDEKQNFPIPFNLSENGKIELFLSLAGFRAINKIPAGCPRFYPNQDTALTAILSSGPARLAIQSTSQKKVADAVRKAIDPFKQKDGGYRMKNDFFLMECNK